MTTTILYSAAQRLGIILSLIFCHVVAHSQTPTSEWKQLHQEIDGFKENDWKGLLHYVADLHEKSTHKACWPFDYDWEEIGPGYFYAPAFGHWDIIHQTLDVLPSCPQHGLNQLKNNVKNQEPSGLVPGSFWMPNNPWANGDSATWSKKKQGHPPVWPLAVDRYIRITRDSSVISHFYLALTRQISWFENERKSNDGAFYYNDIYLRNFESGVDDGVRFEHKIKDKLSCIDATAHVYMLYDRAVAWGDRLGLETSFYAKRRDEIRAYINEKLYDETTGLYLDIWAMEDTSLITISFETMWPLTMACADTAKAHRIIDEYLLNPKHFFTEHPIATVSVSDPTFEMRMWRGPIWNSMTYWAAVSCLNYGREDAAIAILKKALDASAKQFKATGKIWEFYHPHGEAPTSVERKPYTEHNQPSPDYLGP